MIDTKPKPMPPANMPAMRCESGKRRAMRWMIETRHSVLSNKVERAALRQRAEQAETERDQARAVFADIKAQAKNMVEGGEPPPPERCRSTHRRRRN